MSTASITAAVLAELGVPCERHRIDIDAGHTHAPQFLAINPNGMVPVIVHDGVAIWESTAITMYLGEVFGVDAGLYPPLGTKRGEAMKWIAWSGAALFAASGRFAAAMRAAVPDEAARFDANADRGAATLSNAKADVAVQLAIADAALAERDFLLGDYSLADTHLHAIVSWLAMMQIDLEPFAKLSAWVRRCDQRPALRAMSAQGEPAGT